MDRVDTLLRIEPCPADRLEAGLRILYRRVGADLRPSLVAETLGEFGAGELDRAGFWVAGRRGRLIGAMLTQSLGGRAAGIWAPEVLLCFDRGAVAGALVRTALDDLARRGFRIAQALLDESSPRRAADDLARGGLPRVTQLHYLGRETAPPLATAVPEVDWRACSPSDREAFGRTLQATYRDSLDMPELGNVRGLDDILSGHESSGRFDPDRWRLGTRRGDAEPSVVLMLADQPGRDAWEVTYLGVAPEGRGQGLGMAALGHALDLANGRAKRLELAVDDRNGPARRLYERAGFVPFDRRAVHLAVLGGARPARVGGP